MPQVRLQSPRTRRKPLKNKYPRKVTQPIVPTLAKQAGLYNGLPLYLAPTWVLYPIKQLQPYNSFGKVILYPMQPVAVVQTAQGKFTATYTSIVLPGGFTAYLYRNWQTAIYVYAVPPKISPQSKG